jgi:hypothetical protein
MGDPPHPLDALDFGLQFWPAFEPDPGHAPPPASGGPLPHPLPPGLGPGAAAAFHNAEHVHAAFAGSPYGVAAPAGGPSLMLSPASAALPPHLHVARNAHGAHGAGSHHPLPHAGAHYDGLDEFDGDFHGAQGAGCAGSLGSTCRGGDDKKTPHGCVQEAAPFLSHALHHAPSSHARPHSPPSRDAHAHRPVLRRRRGRPHHGRRRRRQRRRPRAHPPAPAVDARAAHALPGRGRRAGGHPRGQA